MFIQVKLLQGYKEPLLYQVDSSWVDSIHIGSLLQVPFRKKIVCAFVEKIFSHQPITNFEIKHAIALEKIPNDPYYFKFIYHLAHYYQTEPYYFFKRLQFFLHNQETFSSDEFLPTDVTFQTEQAVELTKEQTMVVSHATAILNNPQYVPIVLHGVTGSGKTEVYKKLIEKAINNKKSVILLLPEVTLALQFMHLLKQQLPDIVIRSFHSAVNKDEKKRLWNDLLNEKPLLIIGVHLPLLLPIANLGLIIVDEEHETGYQEKKHPKINSKEAALLRAYYTGIPIMLGSATPCVTTLYNVHHKQWQFFQLKERFKGIFPTIKVVALNDKRERKNFWISNELYQAIQKNLAKKEQTLIFINRRGFSFFVQCKQCTFIFYCSSCSVSLTLHEQGQLVCHYCGYTRPLPLSCTECSSTDFLKKGIGTQQIVLILEKLFPTARIARADHDSTINKKKWNTIISSFYKGDIDILVGTQTITKGYHFPKVSLVGILWADLNLHFPIYNATETSLQQLIQVAGRAGRSGLASTVIVQTLADHTIFSYLDELSYLQFYQSELANRNIVNYPPYTRLVEIEFKNLNEQSIEKESLNFAAQLKTVIEQKKLPITVLGPAKPIIEKLKNWHIRKFYLKSHSIETIIEAYKIVNQKQYSSSIFFTPNPLN